MFVWKVQSCQHQSKPSPLFRWLGLDTISPNLANLFSVIIKVGAVMPGMFAVSPLSFRMDSHFITVPLRSNNCRTYFWNGWNARQLVLMMCKTNLHDSNYCDNALDNPEAGLRDNRRALTAYSPATQRASCHWTVLSIVSTGDMLVWRQFFAENG